VRVERCPQPRLEFIACLAPCDGLLIVWVVNVVATIRFLRARKFDVAKAKIMLLAAEKWRKEFATSGIEELMKYVFSLPRSFMFLITAIRVHQKL